MPILMHRFKYITLVVILVAVFSPYLSAAPEKDKVKFTYDVGFEMNFDNREFYKSRFSNSMTIFGARLTPAVGLEFMQSNGTMHQFMH